MAPVKLVSSLPKRHPHKASILATLHAGRRYSVACPDMSVLNSFHGVIGDYRITTKHAEIVPIEPVTATGEMTACCFWDEDIDLSKLQDDIIHFSEGDRRLPLKNCSLKADRLTLNGTALNGPELAVDSEEAVLTLSPRFDFTFSTDSYAAQLGVITLVHSIRSMTLENGDEISLLDTGYKELPVLYLDNPLDNQPIKFVSARQEPGVTQKHTFTTRISQRIFDELEGEAVATITVLEQYCSYFMQRAAPMDDHSIWIPGYAPISWGWSIRVGRRPDGEWGIMRRKLMLPTVGNDGLRLPIWSNNTVDCSSLR